MLLAVATMEPGCVLLVAATIEPGCELIQWNQSVCS